MEAINMSYEQKTWVDRVSTYPTRRILKDVNTEEEVTYDISQSEGIVFNEGVQYNAETMNDLEQRIADAFASVETTMGNILETYYPIGAVYISVVNTSPATLFGGTWTSITGGVLLPANSAGVAGGSDTISYTPSGSITFTGTINSSLADLPAHTHTISVARYDSSAEDWASGSDYGYKNVTTTTSSAGGNQGHTHGFSGGGSFTGNTLTYDNRMPYITVYAWRRTA